MTLQTEKPSLEARLWSESILSFAAWTLDAGIVYVRNASVSRETLEETADEETADELMMYDMWDTPMARGWLK